MDNGFHSSIMTEIIENKQREHLIFRVTLVGSFINFLLLLFKFVAGMLGGSAAMIADAVHSLSDFVTYLIVVLFVLWQGFLKQFLYARHKEFKRHPSDEEADDDGRYGVEDAPRRAEENGAADTDSGADA